MNHHMDSFYGKFAVIIIENKKEVVCALRLLKAGYCMPAKKIKQKKKYLLYLLGNFAAKKLDSPIFKRTQ